MQANKLFLFLIILLMHCSCENNANQNTFSYDNIIGTWIWKTETGETFQTDTNEFEVNIGGCPEAIVFRNLINWETLWEFELDGDFEESLFYDNMEDDFHESQKYCEDKYENTVYTMESLGRWIFENNREGIEISKKSKYYDTVYIDFRIVKLDEGEMILEYDDRDKTQIRFERFE